MRAVDAQSAHEDELANASQGCTVAGTPEQGMGQVDVSTEEERFQDVVTAGLTVLILGIETSLDRALQDMVKMPWATIETVRASEV